MGFAYVDKAGILHVVAQRETAEEYAAKAVVETDLGYHGGFPLCGGQEVVMYSLKEAYANGNMRNGRKLKVEDIPQLVELYRSCM